MAQYEVSNLGNDWIGPTVSGVSNIVGNIVGASGSKKAAKIAAKQSEKNLLAQMQFEREQSNLEWQRNLEQWNRENAYNDPSQVVKRLQDAGLSPALALGNYAGNTAASSPTYNRGHVDFSKVKSEGGGFYAQALGSFLTNLVPNIVSVMNGTKEVEMKDAAIKGYMSDSNLKDTQADALRTESIVRLMNGLMDFSSKRFDYGMKRHLMGNSIEMALKNLEKLKMDIESSKMLNSLRELEIKSKKNDLWRDEVSKDMYQKMGILPGEAGVFGSLKGLFYGIFKMLSGNKDKSGFFDY